MKYIRTKDEIYTLITKDEPIYELNGKKYYCVEEQISSFSEDEVIKQADTIEELCDLFVIEKKEHFIGELKDLPRLSNILKVHNRNNETQWKLYGAIWTDVGLIYVAKMNEKGELELL